MTTTSVDLRSLSRRTPTFLSCLGLLVAMAAGLMGCFVEMDGRTPPSGGGSGGRGPGNTGTGGSGTGGSRVTVTNNGCALPPSGVFLLHYEAKQGATCGVIPDSVVDGSDVQSGESGCMGGSGRITDTPIEGGGCTVVVNVSGCQIADAAGTLGMVGQVTWSADYSSAMGVMSLDIRTPTGSCNGTYSATWTKL